MGLRLLNGLKVLEVGDNVAVAFSGKVLADLGADVLMVEPPGGSPLAVSEEARRQRVPP